MLAADSLTRSEGQGPAFRPKLEVAPSPEVGIECASRHVHRSECRKMLVRELTVDQPVAQPAQAHQRRLRCVAGSSEHGFPKEHPTHRHAVEASDELPVLPCLDRPRMAEPVQPAVGANHLPGYPGRALRGARHGTAPDDISESAVGAEGEMTPPQGLAQASGDPQVLGKEHRTRIGAPPEHRLPLAEPGEDAAAVRAQQAFGSQIAARREQSVRVLERLLDVGKPVGRSRLAHPGHLEKHDGAGAERGASESTEPGRHRGKVPAERI